MVQEGLPVSDEATGAGPGLGAGTQGELLPTREPLRTIFRYIGLAEQAIAVGCMVVIFTLVLLQVLQRYLPGGGWAWTGEVAQLALVWLAFILSGYLMAIDRHITIQLVDYVLPPRALGAVKLLVHLVVGATCLAMAYSIYDLIATDIGQRTPAAEIPLAWIYVVPMVGFVLTLLRAALWIVVADIPQVRGRRPSRSGSMSLALLLILILGLFLLRVPMAFAILGPCLLYLIGEGYSMGLAFRLAMAGIDSWPLLAVPLFILVGIIATRTEIADRLYDAAVLLLGPLRAGLAYVNVGVSLGFSWMSGAALADAAGIGSIEVDHMRRKGYPAEFAVGLSASSALISPIMPPSIPAVVFASVAAVSTGALFAAAVIPAILMTIALCITIWVWATEQDAIPGRAVRLGGGPTRRPAGPPGDGRAGPHPRRHPRRILHPDGGGRGRRLVHARARGELPDGVGARHGADHARHVDRDGPDHDHHRCVVIAQLDPRQGAGAPGRRCGPPRSSPTTRPCSC